MQKLKLAKYLTTINTAISQNPHSSVTLFWALRWAEWALLLMMILLYALDGYVPGISAQPDLLFKVVAFNAAFFLLSFIFPIERPLWQRRTYIAVEILLGVAAQTLGIDSGILLYFTLVKSCFLLSRREVLLTVIVTGICYLFSLAWVLPQHTQTAVEQVRAYSKAIGVTLLGEFIQYLGISIFVVLLGFVIVVERQSRHRAELLAQEVETLAANLERTRIARDIHDSLGHTLTTLGVQLEVAQKLRQRSPELALQALDTAKLLADQCLEDVRRSVQTMRQPNFDFAQALIKLVEQVRQSQSMIVMTEVNLTPLPLTTSQHLYGILQEGLTNIQRHAHASHVNLRVWETPNYVNLTIADDGKGFDPQLPHTGFGLQGMKERVQTLGGSLKIISVLGQGTQIQVKIPQ